jgi:hypothetical protein
LVVGIGRPSAYLSRRRLAIHATKCFGGLIAGSILLSPVFAFLMALAVVILIGLVSDGGALALLALVAAGAIGGILLRELRMCPQDNPQDWT